MDERLTLGDCAKVAGVTRHQLGLIVRELASNLQIKLPKQKGYVYGRGGLR